MKQITPNLWFNGNAEEAVNFYLSVFPDSKIMATSHYPEEGLLDFQKEFAGKVLTIEFELSGNHFIAINADGSFKFNEAVSFMIPCKDQEEIDYYWDKLSADPASEQCGWLKDTYGLSWQVIPENLEELLSHPGAYEHFMNMHKIVIKDL
jgi:predicted 3-demethylubiquinone-9 3-methyltransferase (glyoxalase superfamily)